jgi:hypothetical protein
MIKLLRTYPYIVEQALSVLCYLMKLPDPIQTYVHTHKCLYWAGIEPAYTNLNVTLTNMAYVTPSTYDDVISLLPSTFLVLY